MRTLKRITALVLAVLLLPLRIYAAEDSVFIRIDRDDPDAWKEELANVRFLEEEGMSGSAQFSETQFGDLAAELKEESEDVWIVDCRLESHGGRGGSGGGSAFQSDRIDCHGIYGRE